MLIVILDGSDKMIPGLPLKLLANQRQLRCFPYDSSYQLIRNSPKYLGTILGVLTGVPLSNVGFN